MTGRDKFTLHEIETLRLLVKKYSQANSPSDQKAVRVKLRKIGFYVSDFGIQNITSQIFEGFINKGYIKCSDRIIETPVFVKPNPILKPAIAINQNDIENQLTNGTFKKAGLIDSIVPAQTGFYCIRLVKGAKLPERYQCHLDKRKHTIIYLGKAEGQTLYKRFLGQEMRAKGHGTFFRSIGAVLGYKPEKGSLKNAKNKNNYTFSVADEEKIIKWINHNLEVNWVEYQGDFSIEAQFISNYRPLLNDSHNPVKLEELRIDKANCRTIAIS